MGNLNASLRSQSHNAIQKIASFSAQKPAVAAILHNHVQRQVSARRRLWHEQPQDAVIMCDPPSDPFSLTIVLLCSVRADDAFVSLQRSDCYGGIKTMNSTKKKT